MSRGQYRNFQAANQLSGGAQQGASAVKEYLGASIALSILSVIALAGIGNLFLGWW
jgi:hypothetical protein